MSNDHRRISLAGAAALLTLGAAIGALGTVAALDASGPDVDWGRVISHVGDLGPLATALAAAVAATVGLTTLRQRAYADARAEWWRRAQWAAERQLSSNANERHVARGVLLALATDPLAGGAGSREAQFLEAFTAAAMVDDAQRPQHNGTRARRWPSRRAERTRQ